MNHRRFHDLYLQRESAKMTTYRLIVCPAAFVKRVASRLHLPSALLPQPALLVRVEERMHQVVAVVLRYLERLCPNGFIQRLRFGEGEKGN